MPSLTKTLVCLAVSANAFLAPAPQRPATVMQAATIAAKDVSALRKASGPDPVPNMHKKRRLQTGRAGRSAPDVRKKVAAPRDAIAATRRSPRNKTQAPA